MKTQISKEAGEAAKCILNQDYSLFTHQQKEDVVANIIQSALDAQAKRKIKVGTFGILERDGKVLMGLRNSTDTSFPGCWCHPGGGIEFQELVDAALKREFWEEVLLDVAVGNNYIQPHENIQNGRHVVLIFKEVFSNGLPKAGDGFSEISWFSIEQIRMLAKEGKTTPLGLPAAEHWHRYKTEAERYEEVVKAAKIYCP